MISSVENVTEISDRKIGSDWFEQRNHHGNGNLQIQTFITKMFGEQSWMKNSDEQGFQFFLYFSQIYQARVMKILRHFQKIRDFSTL